MGFFLSLFCIIQTFSYSVRVNLDADNTSLTGYGEYTLISALDLDYFGRAFLPVLPAKRLQILLPYDAELKSIKTEGSDPCFVGYVPLPLPALVQAPLGMRQEVFMRTDPSVYDGFEKYPASILQNSHFGNQAGFKILSVLLVPYSWYPQTGELTMHENVTITVEYDRTSATQNLTPLAFEIHKKIISGIVCNPEMLHQWSPSVRDGNFDYLIIAPSSYLATAAIDSLVSHKSSRGLVCDTASKEMISSSVSGSDLPEKIRNYIIQRHQTDGITFVLLVGDKNLLQPREIFLNCRDTNGVYYDDSAPVDLYFADLDGDWNFNSDNRYGQPDDSLDLYADVFVGRLVVSSISQLSVNVEKICQYETDPPQGQWRTRSLLAGAVLFENQYYTITGEAVCESIADHLPSNWHHVKMYETLYGNSPEGAIDSVNEGVAWTQ
ncbi:hypothetical protein JXA84_07330 [candidate division WOR-3 bacterium]|nr:hypothetical protein [candidate division WOR-3 bacterium]